MLRCRFLVICLRSWSHTCISQRYVLFMIVCRGNLIMHAQTQKISEKSGTNENSASKSQYHRIFKVPTFALVVAVTSRQCSDRYSTSL